jgi:hypothetical protein
MQLSIAIADWNTEHSADMNQLSLSHCQWSFSEREAAVSNVQQGTTQASV